MNLEKGERSVLASFQFSNAAEKAAQKLVESGYNNVQVDRISRYGATTDANYNNPINNAGSNTGVSIYSKSAGDVSEDARVLMAADPSVSGYGNVDYGVAGGEGFLLTVVIPDQEVARAENIIRENGGKL
jgi:hypothetical protein